MAGAFIETGKRVWDPWGLSNYVSVDVGGIAYEGRWKD